MRLLNAILDRGLAPDERSARGLILAGKVRVNGRPTAHEGFEVTATDALEVEPPAGRRGARKLEPVLDSLSQRGQPLLVEDRICADLGCSAGGFTSVLLRERAARVYAVDIGYGVLASELRSDPRVVVLERTNARLLSPRQIPDALECVVGDLSFISWRAVLPALTPLLSPGAQLLLLVKPQFELAALGRGRELARGIATPQLALEAVSGMFSVWQSAALTPQVILPAGLSGAKGNQEYFVLLHSVGSRCTEDQYMDLVCAALGEGA